MKLVGNSRAIRSPEFHKKKQKEKILKVCAVAFLTLAVLVAPIFALRYDRLLIQNIVVEGHGATREEEIMSVARERLAGNYLWIIPKRNFLFAPKNAIEENLMAAIPRLSSAEVDFENINTLKIRVAERTPFALYCEEVSDPANPEKCFFLDESGNIFSEAPNFSGEVYMIYSSEPLIESPLRSQLVESGEFDDIVGFLKSLAQMGVNASAVIKRGSEFAAILQGGTELKWKSGQNLESLASDLNSFLKDSKIKATAFGDLLYIDLRFDNKIYWLPKE